MSDQNHQCALRNTHIRGCNLTAQNQQPGKNPWVTDWVCSDLLQILKQWLKYSAGESNKLPCKLCIGIRIHGSGYS